MPITSTKGAASAQGFGWLFQATAAPPEGELYAWGTNSNGRLGLGDTTSRSSPVQVGALTTWSDISGGSAFSGGVTSDGKLWMWGAGNNGALGQGNTTDYSSPVQVGALTTWDRVFSNNFFTYAIKTDGTLWAWGLNSSGQLGQNNLTSYSSPVQVGALTTWARASRAGNAFGHLIKTDGTLWGVGTGAVGALGTGNTTGRSSPVQIGALTDWALSNAGDTAAVFLKTDGTIWFTGLGNYGINGQGTTTNYSSPVQIGAGTNWAHISLCYNQGSAEFVAATKTDGTLWAWGNNQFGQLGQGNVTTRSSPVQVGALTDWAYASTGGRYCVAIKTDGTLWAWGRNDSGQLGLGDTTDRSSPVQVGAATNWLTIFDVGWVHALAIRG
jgi:hypothetical protein